jgi:hypothetical protein
LKPLPETDNAIVLRSDFANPGAWSAIQQELARHFSLTPDLLEIIDDPNYSGVSPDQLAELTQDDSELSFVILADGVAMSSDDYPMLVVDLVDEPGRTFRAIPSELFGIASNLSIANMDFAEFANAVGDDGIFRGF